MTYHHPIVILSLLISAFLLMAAGGGGAAPIPDFTEGDPMPNTLKHDTNLGSTGARGWIYSDHLVTSDARQILITKVDAGSPADGV